MISIGVSVEVATHAGDGRNLRAIFFAFAIRRLLRGISATRKNVALRLKIFPTSRASRQATAYNTMSVLGMLFAYSRRQRVTSAGKTSASCVFMNGNARRRLCPPASWKLLTLDTRDRLGASRSLCIRGILLLLDLRLQLAAGE